MLIGWEPFQHGIKTNDPSTGYEPWICTQILKSLQGTVDNDVQYRWLS